jgi:MFS family permease
MGETIRARHRGKAVGTVQSGWAIGWGIAATCYVVLFSRLPAVLAWRVMFWIGILPALLVFYIRRYVPEPEIFQRTRKRQASSGEPSRLFDIFSPQLLRTTLLASLLSLGVQGGYHAITTWLPTYLQASRGLSVMKTGGNLALVICGAFFGYLTAAGLADRLGRKRTLVLFAAGSLLTVIGYTYLHTGSRVALLLGFPLGFFASGSFSPVGSLFTELFPSRLRGSGQGFSYSFGRGAGALFPALVGFLSAHVGLGNAIAGFAAAAYLVMMAAVLLLPETSGKELQVESS